MKHKLHYPVTGGSGVCEYCGKQNPDAQEDCKALEPELTKEQMDRQDLVDNAIFDMMKIVDPSPEREGSEGLEWDMQIVSEVRDIVQEYFLNLGVCTEMEFYPYLEESDESDMQQSQG